MAGKWFHLSVRTDLTPLFAAVGERWRAIDPLLPEPALPFVTDARLLVVPPPPAAEAPPAVGLARRVRLPSAALELLWAPADQLVLAPRVASAAGLDALLAQWRTRVTELTPGDDSAAIILWPSRDAAGVPALLAHGLAPYTVLAVRTAAAGDVVEPPAGVKIRRAGPADAAAVAERWLSVIRYDAQFGVTFERPGMDELISATMAEVLAAEEPYVWVAERDDAVVGLVRAFPPGEPRWVTSLVSAAPAAYISILEVAPGRRGGGVGGALVDHVHRELDAAVTLVHYAQVNPLSAPFWSRQGYRPLWTEWRAAPAGALR